MPPMDSLRRPFLTSSEKKLPKWGLVRESKEKGLIPPSNLETNIQALKRGKTDS